MGLAPVSWKVVAPLISIVFLELTFGCHPRSQPLPFSPSSHTKPSYYIEAGWFKSFLFFDRLSLCSIGYLELAK